MKPATADLRNFPKRRSPDCRTVVWVANGQFCAYDFTKDETKTLAVDRRASMPDCQWLDEDKCAVILGRTVQIYDRQRNKLSENCGVPQGTTRIGDPAPGSRFLFCSSARELLVVDLEKKTAEPMEANVQSYVWLNGDTLVFSRKIQDTALRGTWVKQIGGEARRITEEPFSGGRTGELKVLALKDASLFLFETRAGLAKMSTEGTGLELMPPHPVALLRLTNVESLPKSGDLEH